MRYSEDIIEDIRIGNDIVDVIGQYMELRQRGSSFVGLCPFHKEGTPSFSVSSDKQLYHCFGCGASGTVYNFVMDIENLDFIDTLRYLADRINYTLPTHNLAINKEDLDKKQNIYDIHKIVARKFYENLSTPTGKIANDYLDNRGISTGIRTKFGIGYALLKKDDIYAYLKEKGYRDDVIVESGLVIKGKNGGFFDRFSGRIMFPIIDVQGRIIAFGGRDITGNDKTAKYLNSPDTPIFNKSYNLYSINFAKNTRNKEFILVEGYMDVIALYQAGIQNVVASLGTAFNENHIKLLKKYASKTILFFDSDEAGIKATLRAIPILVKNGLSVRVAQTMDAKDPDEYIKKFGANSFINLLNSAKSYILFEIEQKLKEYDLKDPMQKVEFTKIVAGIIANLSGPVERDVFTKEVSKITNIPNDVILEEVKLILPNTDPMDKIKINRHNKNNSNTRIGGNKLDEARRGIISIIANNLTVCEKISNHLKPEEFMEPIYIKLTKIIFESSIRNQIIHPAEIALKFEDKQEQQEIAKIFMLKFDFNENENLEKIINDQLRIIKKAYYDTVLLECEDMLKITQILKEKKIFDKLYIKI